jgi:hypothetical protein
MPDLFLNLSGHSSILPLVARATLRDGADFRK